MTSINYPKRVEAYERQLSERFPEMGKDFIEAIALHMALNHITKPTKQVRFTVWLGGQAYLEELRERLCAT